MSWESWNNIPEATENKWDADFNELNDQFITHQSLNTIDAMLRSSDPKLRELGQKIVAEQGGGHASSLREHNERRISALKNQVGAPKNNKQRRPGFNDNNDTTKRAASVLRGLSK